MAKKIEAPGMLDWLVEEIKDEPRQPDEFTVKEAVAELRKKTGQEISISAMRNRLWELKQKGKLTTRQFVENGSRTTLYRRKP